jgi:putative PIN family toxin of toxin-antitoxin system
MVDANILIAGSVWPRWPYEVLQHAADGDFDLVLSPYIISQAHRKLTEKFPNSTWRLERLLELPNVEIVKDPTKEQLAKSANLVRDETDIPIALAAINAQVDYLVSEDKDLTSQDETTDRLRSQLTVMLSGTFLREVMG